jgi:hypothetical protein
MGRFLVILGLAVVVIGLLWPFLAKLGIGRLPGDIVVERDNFTLYIPLATSLIASLALTALLWAINR